MQHDRYQLDSRIFSFDSQHIQRRARRSITHESDHRNRRLRGVARDCGHACHIRLRSNQEVYEVHLHRWNQIPASHNKSIPVISNSNYAPIVLHLDSADSVRGRMARIEPDCIYRAHVRGVEQHSIVNLCDTDDGLVGLFSHFRSFSVTFLNFSTDCWPCLTGFTQSSRLSAKMGLVSVF